MIDVKGKTVYDFIENDEQKEYLKSRYKFKTDKELKDYYEKQVDIVRVDRIIDFAHLTKNDELLTSAIAYKKQISSRTTEECVKTGSIVN